MFPFRHAENHERGCGSSMDPEMKASSGHRAANCRLLKSRSVFLLAFVDIGRMNKPTFCLVQFDHNILQSFYHPIRYSIGLLPEAILNVPRVRETLAADSFPSASRNMNTQQKEKEERGESNSHHP